MGISPVAVTEAVLLIRLYLILYVCARLAGSSSRYLSQAYASCCSASWGNP